MKCFFCQQPIPSKEIFQSKGFGDIRVGDCPNCKSDSVISTMVTEDGQLISAHLYVQWGEERYRALLHIKDNYFALFHISSDKTDRYEIYKINQITDVNFNNILTKLPIYLTFL